jgi:hypothetical protein
MKLSVHLYNERPSPALNLKELISFLKEKSIKAEIKSSLIERGDIDEISRQFASCKVVDLKTCKECIPLSQEIEYEKKRLTKRLNSSLLYDGFKLSHLFSNLIPKEEQNLSHCHIVLCGLLFGTFTDRYHARVAIFSFPSLISTKGLTTALALPKGSYLAKAMGVDVEVKVIEEGMITEIIKGYLLQAIAYHITGYPFCSDPGCRLYNAHWQEEAVNAQITSPYELCKKHSSLFSNNKEALSKWWFKEPFQDRLKREDQSVKKKDLKPSL